MLGVNARKWLSQWQSFTTETDMEEADMNASLDDLAGRMDGMAQALLRVVSELEMAQLIDGSHLSRTWRQARPRALATDPQRAASRRVLLQLADMLDDARQIRQACETPSG